MVSNANQTPRETGPGQFQKSKTSLLTSLAVCGYRLTIGPQGAGHNKRKEAFNGHRSSRSNRTRYSWSWRVYRTMKRSPGLVTPGNSHSVGYTWPLQMGTAAEIPDPEANRQSLGKLCMTLSTAAPCLQCQSTGTGIYSNNKTPAAQGPRAMGGRDALSD